MSLVDEAKIKARENYDQAKDRFCKAIPDTIAEIEKVMSKIRSDEIEISEGKFEAIKDIHWGVGDFGRFNNLGQGYVYVMTWVVSLTNNKPWIELEIVLGIDCSGMCGESTIKPTTSAALVEENIKNWLAERYAKV